MTFLNFSLLAGTALVALPILLHLIMRRKPRHLEFPALRFLEARRETNQRQLRLRHLLLLALRVALILFLAVALARPSVKFSGALGSQKAPVAAALVFDTSMRMEYVHENRTRLEAAQEFGLWVLGQLPKESEIAVLDARRGAAAFQAHRGAARHRIEQLATTAAAQPMTTVLEEAVRLLGMSKLAGRELYVFSDLARVSWPAETAAALQGLLASHPELNIYIIDVGVENGTNTSLSELRLSDQVLSSRAPLTISTDIDHRGAEESRTVELYLEDLTSGDLTAQKSKQRIVELSSEGSQRVEFKIDILEQGIHQGYVEIAGDDALMCDNRRFFTVEVKDAWRVLVVAPQPTAERGQFLTYALAPIRFRQEGRARFDCELIEYGELVQKDLDDYAAVWLLDPPGLEAATWTKLEDYVRVGHGLAVCLGGNASRPGPLEAFRTSAALAVLPGTIVRQARSPDAYLKPGLSQHPILNDFRAIDQTIPWELQEVRRYWQLKQLADGASTVASLSDGSPVILERPLGSGRVVMMTTPISDPLNDDAWNYLPREWPFVTLVNGMASYLVGSLDQTLNYSAGATVSLRLNPQHVHRSYAMRAPGDIEVRLTPDLAQNTLIITSTDAVGNYRVAAGGTADAYRGGFSVNLAPEQTDLTRADHDHLKDVFGETPFRMARQRSELEGNVSRGRVGRELFPTLILLLAFVLAAEHVLANRFYRQ